MISIRNVTVQFGGVRPLNELSVDLDGQVIGIVGPNGAGKTTLLNVMSGFVTPVEGTVHVDGTDITAMNPFTRARWGIRRSFQTEQVVDSISVRENVAVMLDAVKMPRRERAVAIDRALEITGLAPFAATSPRDLTSYQRRLVEITRAIVGKPRVVMMDEPAAGLSEAEGGEFRDLVLSLHEVTGATVMLIDHDVDLIAAVCEKTAVLDFGRLITFADTRAALDHPETKAAYLGLAEEEVA